MATEGSLERVPAPVERDQDPRAMAQRLDTQADLLRADIQRTVEELLRRARSAVDVRRQIRRHPWVIAGAGAVVTGLIVAKVVRERARRRRARTFKARAARFVLWLLAPTPPPQTVVVAPQKPR